MMTRRPSAIITALMARVIWFKVLDRDAVSVVVG